MPQSTISIIIPVLNEAKVIRSALETLQKNYGQQVPDLAIDLEIIVVDGGSQDNTVSLAQQTGLKVIIVQGKGRSAQMNAGAEIASGNILLFLHVDTQLPPDFAALAIKTLNQPKVVAGAFELAIAGEDKSLRWVEKLVKARSHLLYLPYGDQAIFIEQQIFKKIGGYSDLPIMEDFEIIQRLKRQGKIAIAPAQVTTSGRRWQQLGVWRTTLINQLVVAGYFLGVSPGKLSNLYRNRRKSK